MDRMAARTSTDEKLQAHGFSPWQLIAPSRSDLPFLVGCEFLVRLDESKISRAAPSRERNKTLPLFFSPGKKWDFLKSFRNDQQLPFRIRRIVPRRIGQRRKREIEISKPVQLGSPERTKHGSPKTASLLILICLCSYRHQAMCYYVHPYASLH